MRPVQNLNPIGPKSSDEQFRNYVLNMIDRLCDASQEDAGALADPYTVTNAAPRRVFDAQTATLAETAETLATFLQDTKKRGMNRRAG